MMVESNKGEWNVWMYDDSMKTGFTVKCLYLEGVTEAIAKSVVRHMNSKIFKLESQIKACMDIFYEAEIDAGIDIFYEADNPYNHDIGEMYGGESVLMHS